MSSSRRIGLQGQLWRMSNKKRELYRYILGLYGDAAKYDRGVTTNGLGCENLFPKDGLTKRYVRLMPNGDTEQSNDRHTWEKIDV